MVAAAIAVAVLATGAEPDSVRSLRAAAEGTILIGVGLSDSIAARPQDWPLLFDRAGQPKPAFDAVLAALQQATQTRQVKRLLEPSAGNNR
jgi:hypothetical protein